MEKANDIDDIGNVKKKIQDDEVEVEVEVDNAHKAKLSKFLLLRIMWILLGSFFVALGTIGIFIPGLPTTVFLIIAAGCYIRSSEKLYNWLINNKTFGPLIKDYREGKGMPKKAKVLALSMITIFAGSSSIFLIDNPPIQILVGILGIIGFWYVGFRVPTNKSV
tara:strand:- start:110 stop:601 length:492 start_codon:yes stop_codon:yes gene_type:complete